MTYTTLLLVPNLTVYIMKANLSIMKGGCGTLWYHGVCVCVCWFVSQTRVVFPKLIRHWPLYLWNLVHTFYKRSELFINNTSRQYFNTLCQLTQAHLKKNEFYLFTFIFSTFFFSKITIHEGSIGYESISVISLVQMNIFHYTWNVFKPVVILLKGH